MVRASPMVRAVMAAQEEVEAAIQLTLEDLELPVKATMAAADHLPLMVAAVAAAGQEVLEQVLELLLPGGTVAMGLHLPLPVLPMRAAAEAAVLVQ